MTTVSQSNIEAIHDIRKIMDRSSRFISLSGWSGVAAGICALTGAWIANVQIVAYTGGTSDISGCLECLRSNLILTGVTVFVIAFVAAIVLTYLKIRKDGVSIWGVAQRRLLYNTLLPMAVGGLLIWRMIDLGYYELIAPSTLIFYGLALVNGSKYTLGEVRYLGYAEILTGIIALFVVSGGIYAWAFGFGVLHIIYGIVMWRTQKR